MRGIEIPHGTVRPAYLVRTVSLRKNDANETKEDFLASPPFSRAIKTVTTKRPQNDEFAKHELNMDCSL